MRKSSAAAAILMLLSAACTRPSEPLEIHDPSKILHIEVTQWNENGDRGPSGDYTIEDRKRIESIVELLRSNNTGYRETTDWANWFAKERSRERYTFHLQESLHTVAPLSVSFGSDWLSGIDEQKDDRGFRYFRTRPLSGSEREALVALVERRPEDQDR